MCNYTYGITSIAMGGTDLCTPYTLSNGYISNCGSSFKKVEPQYSVMTGFDYYDAYDESRNAANNAYESALSTAAFHSHPIPSAYTYVSSYTAVGTPETGYTCTPNYSSINYTWYLVMVDQVTSTSGGYYWGYGNGNGGFTKSYYDVTLPVWGRVSGLYYYGGYYNYYNPYGWPYNNIGGDTSFLDCDMIVADMGYTARKENLTGNNLTNPYGYYWGSNYWNYYGYGNLQNLNISDIGYGTSVTFVDTGALVKQEVPALCDIGCMTPTTSVDVYYFDLIPAGGNSFFTNYGFGYYGYNSWLTGEYHCLELTEGSCSQATETVRFSPEFPEQLPYNSCDPADYFWVEPCTRFSS